MRGRVDACEFFHRNYLWLFGVSEIVGRAGSAFARTFHDMEVNHGGGDVGGTWTLRLCGLGSGCHAAAGCTQSKAGAGVPFFSDMTDRWFLWMVSSVEGRGPRFHS